MSIETLVVVEEEELETFIAAGTDELAAGDDDDKEEDVVTSLPSANLVLVAFPYFFKLTLILFVLLLPLLMDLAGSLFAPHYVIDLATALAL